MTTTDDEEMFGEIEPLAEFLDRDGDLLEELGLERTEYLAAYIATPFMCGFTGDRSRIALHVLAEFDEFVKPFADLPDDAKPFTRAQRDKLQNHFWIAAGCNHDELASRFVRALPVVIRDECMEKAAALMAEHPAGALQPQTASLDVAEMAEKAGDEAEQWAMLSVADNAGNPPRENLVERLLKVGAAYPAALSDGLTLARAAVDDLELVESLRTLFKSNVWKPERAVAVLAPLVEMAS